MQFARISIDSQQMGGVPCIRGMRIPVATILRMLGAGMTEKAILEDYPDLELADIRESLQYAAATVLERELPLQTA